MTSVLSDSMIVAAEGGHAVVNELPFAPIWFGVIALVAFFALLGFLWAFRNTLSVDPRTHHAHGGHATGRVVDDGTGHGSATH
ncbi:hypothetical protein [Ornithinimicrobium panacihumi]|uniref:hypothetical protein n=1 Tax=Ornithinimicrobium panacihumi TaxID=2008449 RepID=UPI003F8C41EB